MKTASNDKYNGVSEVVEFIKKTYRKNYSVDYYAALCSLQKCYFITLFKSYTGVSPQRFRTNIRIEKAKELQDNGQLERGYALSWELYRVLNNLDPNKQYINDDTYLSIDDETIDIDAPWQIERLNDRIRSN